MVNKSNWKGEINFSNLHLYLPPTLIPYVVNNVVNKSLQPPSLCSSFLLKTCFLPWLMSTVFSAGSPVINRATNLLWVAIFVHCSWSTVPSERWGKARCRGVQHLMKLIQWSQRWTCVIKTVFVEYLLFINTFLPKNIKKENKLGYFLGMNNEIYFYYEQIEMQASL